ncbi:MAG: hypothetical protein FWD06_03110 [Oscillospiraceae bacterium]|nr:hypothetical protein [Oscillospiraceae bacterium]
MTKKLLAAVLALTMVFAFGMVATADTGYLCECPGEALCIEACDCAETGECICPAPDCGRNWWPIILGVLAGIATLASMFFITRIWLTCIFC